MRTLMVLEKEQYIAELQAKFESYATITRESWSLIASIVVFKALEKGEVLLSSGQVAQNLHFLCKGAIRAYIADDNGNIYNKNIFLEKDFCGSKVSLLQGTPSRFTLEALEESILINIDYKKYRECIEKREDLKNFYIAYLEKNWVIEKEQREISIVMENAAERYLKLLIQHPNIDQRIPQLHIAAHLGITPTQLSRIRARLKKTP